LVAYQLRP